MGDRSAPGIEGVLLEHFNPDTMEAGRQISVSVDEGMKPTSKIPDKIDATFCYIFKDSKEPKCEKAEMRKELWTVLVAEGEESGETRFVILQKEPIFS